MSASVLYVDDDRNLCQIVAKAIAGEGYSVRTCHDGAEALAIVEEQLPDLMLLDLKLPRRDGLQVLAELRKSDGEMRNLPVVVLTGAAPTPACAQRVNELKAIDLLTKPVSLEKLLDVVARAVAGAKREVPAQPRGEAAARKRGGSGNLERVAFPALLHHLHGLRATGTLQLECEKKRKWIELRDGYPVAVRSNLMRETLGKHLLTQRPRLARGARGVAPRGGEERSAPRRDPRGDARALRRAGDRRAARAGRREVLRDLLVAERDVPLRARSAARARRTRSGSGAARRA